MLLNTGIVPNVQLVINSVPPKQDMTLPLPRLMVKFLTLSESCQIPSHFEVLKTCSHLVKKCLVRDNVTT